MNNDFYIYELQYPDGTPFYVGKGKDDRYKKHFKNYNSSNPLKQNVINKIRTLDQEPIVQIIVENLIESAAFEIEISLIAYYGRRDNKTGILTNMTDGGEGVSGQIVSEETRQKISDARCGKYCGENNPNYGNHHTEETKEKIRQSCQGKKTSEETRKKISTAVKGKNHPNYGKKASEETRKKMSVAAKGKVPSKEAINKTTKANQKPVYQIDLNTHDIINSWGSIKSAGEKLNICRTSISQACRGNLKSAGGYKWVYVK